MTFSLFPFQELIWVFPSVPLKQLLTQVVRTCVTNKGIPRRREEMSQTERLNSVKANKDESGLGVLPPVEECACFSYHDPHLLYLKRILFYASERWGSPFDLQVMVWNLTSFWYVWWPFVFIWWGLFDHILYRFFVLLLYFFSFHLWAISHF